MSANWMPCPRIWGGASSPWPAQPWSLRVSYDLPQARRWRIGVSSCVLNGFAISEPVACTRSGELGGVICTPSAGVGVGIKSNGGSSSEGASVSNGTVSGMGQSGIPLGDDATVTRVRARSNDGAGIRVGDMSRVSGSIARLKRDNGIQTQTSVVRVGRTSRVFRTTDTTYSDKYAPTGIGGPFRGNQIASLPENQQRLSQEEKALFDRAGSWTSICEVVEEDLQNTNTHRGR